MSYSAGETLVLTVLRTISGNVWTSTNSASGKWGLLNSGKSDHYAILKPGAGSSVFASLSQQERTYQTVIEVWQSYRTDGTSLSTLVGYMEAIIDIFAKYRKLGDTTGAVRDSSCIGWGEVTEQWRKGGDGPRWLMQEFVIEWREDESITFSE